MNSMNYKIKLCYCLLILATFISFKNPNKKTSFNLNLQEFRLIHFAGDNTQVNIRNSGNGISKKYKWTFLNSGMAEATPHGEVNDFGMGAPITTVKYNLSIDSCIVENNKDGSTYPLDLSPIGKELSNDNIFSSNVQLIAPFRVLQSFDFDNYGNIYYSQIGASNGFVQGKSKAHELYIIKGKPNVQVGNDYMTLKYFGHGGNIAVEEDNGSFFIWVSSNATKYSSGEYWDARSVSRVKYESGKVYEGYRGETYFLNNGLCRIQAAIDKKSDLICINATKSGVRYFYTYALSKVQDLPLVNFTFSVKIGGEEIGTKSDTVSRIVQGHDLSQLKPLGKFQLPAGKNKVLDVNSYAFQGYDIDASRNIYFFEGEGSGSNLANSSSQAYVTVFDLNGNVMRNRTSVLAIGDKDNLKGAGITNSSGYMEAEGIKVKGNHLYLGFASYQEDENYRRANVLSYVCVRN